MQRVCQQLLLPFAVLREGQLVTKPREHHRAQGALGRTGRLQGLFEPSHHLGIDQTGDWKPTREPKRCFGVSIVVASAAREFGGPLEGGPPACPVRTSHFERAPQGKQNVHTDALVGARDQVQ